MKKKTDFKKLVLGSAGKKRVKEGNWDLFGGRIKLDIKRGKPKTLNGKNEYTIYYQVPNDNEWYGIQGYYEKSATDARKRFLMWHGKEHPRNIKVKRKYSY